MASDDHSANRGKRFNFFCQEHIEFLDVVGSQIGFTEGNALQLDLQFDVPRPNLGFRFGFWFGFWLGFWFGFWFGFRFGGWFCCCCFRGWAQIGSALFACFCGCGQSRSPLRVTDADASAGCGYDVAITVGDVTLVFDLSKRGQGSTNRNSGESCKNVTES